MSVRKEVEREKLGKDAEM